MTFIDLFQNNTQKKKVLRTKQLVRISKSDFRTGFGFDLNVFSRCQDIYVQLLWKVSFVRILKHKYLFTFSLMTFLLFSRNVFFAFGVSYKVNSWRIRYNNLSYFLALDSLQKNFCKSRLPSHLC